MVSLRRSRIPRRLGSHGRAAAPKLRAPVRRDAAGRSADLIFRSARREWRRAIQLRLMLVVVAFALLALPVSLFTPDGGFGAGLVLGIILGMAAWAWDQPPPFVERWPQGRDGERQTARELKELRRDGWIARHDLRSTHGNTDHLLVGPDDVFVLDSKNPWGTFTIEAGVLTCHHPSLPLSDYSMPKLPRKLAAAARALEQRLQERLGWIVDVHPVLVLWAPFPTRHARLGRVTIMHGNDLVGRCAHSHVASAIHDQLTVSEAVKALPAADKL